MLERKVLDFLISPSFVKGDLGGFQKVKEQSKTAKKHPMETEIQQFLLKRDVDIDNAPRLLYIVSIMANFLIFRSIKKHAKLPNIRQEEDKADENRMEKLGQALSYECEQLNIEFQEIMNELVFPMAGNTALVKPMLKKITRSLSLSFLPIISDKPRKARSKIPIFGATV